MLRSDFAYDLPAELIAQVPLRERSASRLLLLDGDSGRVEDRCFRDLPDLLLPGDLLVFNDTQVIPARVFGRKASGGQVELLLERIVAEGRMLAQVRVSKPPRPGSTLVLDGDVGASVAGRQDEFYLIDLAPGWSVIEYLRAHGHIPLPPYIQRTDADDDRERYQTVYARAPGAVAAPTAGLHFDKPMLDALCGLGVGTGAVTLHVGAGTFQPMRCERLDEHHMHAEAIEVSESLCHQVEDTRKRGGRVVAVGTTSVRALESAWNGERLAPMAGETRLFIHPGYRFKVVDAMITNFHLPESTLLMLVCAFAGQDEVLTAYQHAVAARYRFFSYGDAMWVTKKKGATSGGRAQKPPPRRR